MNAAKSTRPQIHHLDQGFAAATWLNVVIVVWRDAPDLARTRDALDVLEQSANTTGGAGLWTIVEEGSAVAALEVRTYAALRLEELGPRLLFQATSVETTGAEQTMMVATLRSTMNIGSARPVYVGCGITEVAGWISPRIASVSPRDLCFAADEVRAAVDATPTPLTNRAVTQRGNVNRNK
jgi:hypothetical protein